MHGKKRFIELSLAEKKQLVLSWKTGKSSTYRERCHYILLSHQGKQIKEISDFYGKSRQSITRWFNRYEEKGIEGLLTSKGQGRPPILRLDNQLEMSKVESLVAQYPQNLKYVISILEKDFGKSMSLKTLQRLLKKKATDGNVVEE